MADRSDLDVQRAQRLIATGRVDDSLAVLDDVLARNSGHLVALSLKAATLARQRRLDDADAAFQALIGHHPGEWRGWLNYGHLLKTASRHDDAVAAYRRATAIHQAAGAAWWALANLRSVRFDAGDVAAMRSALAATSDGDERLNLHFALAAAFDAARDHAAAFEHLRVGNALRRARAPHDAAAFSAMLRRIEARLTPDFLAARTGAGVTARDPIFIVGLPRAGSTLVEQILASHPLIEATEELHDLNRVAATVATGGSYVDGVAALAPSGLRELGERYLAATRRHRITDRPFFTDKMPSNWLYAGLIRLILPRARIVDVRRHPMACGFANFAQHYGWGNNFAYDLGDIGRFYADYVRHMAHIDAVAPGTVHRVQHEALVDDPEAEVRRLLAYLGVPFDPACLRFHESRRTARTPSAQQVRRPINREGLDRWTGYARWLGPLERALGPALADYPAIPPGISAD